MDTKYKSLIVSVSMIKHFCLVSRCWLTGPETQQ